MVARKMVSLAGAVVLAITAPATAGSIDGRLQALLDGVAAGQKIPVIVSLEGRPDLQGLASAEGGRGRLTGGTVAAGLNRATEVAAGPVENYLRERGYPSRRLWIAHAIGTSVPAATVPALARLSGVESVRLDGVVQQPRLSTTEVPAEWNLAAVRAPDVWALGHRGEGAVVATLDTGVDGAHPDLSGRWRGGSNSWFDAHGEFTAPTDDKGHGTQVTGLMVGGDHGGTAVGIAPGATWIAARIFDRYGVARYSDVHSAFQWVLDPDGDFQTDDSPIVVNGAWSLAPGECDTEFEPDIAALRLAGTAAVFSAGNDGPDAGTSVSPANYSHSFAVGASDSQAEIAEYSGTGPSACDGRLWPDVVAPGVSVVAPDLTYGGVLPDSYATVSGTSFAAAQVSGALALLAAAFPGTSVEIIADALRATAFDLAQSGPDFRAGYGQVDLLAAYERLAGGGGASPLDADGDGHSPPADCDDGAADVHPGAIEIKRDGVDQDCDGYDLTIVITAAVYKTSRKQLEVTATSDLGAGAALELSSFGPMTWDAKKRRWTYVAAKLSSAQARVTVFGPEGSETATVSVKK